MHGGAYNRGGGAYNRRFTVCLICRSFYSKKSSKWSESSNSLSKIRVHFVGKCFSNRNRCAGILQLLNNVSGLPNLQVFQFFQEEKSLWTEQRNKERISTKLRSSFGLRLLSVWQGDGGVARRRVVMELFVDDDDVIFNRDTLSIKICWPQSDKT